MSMKFIIKSEQTQEISRLMNTLQDKIQDKMVTFFDLGREAKRLSLQAAEPDKIQEVHLHMAEILNDLKDVDCIVRMMYPGADMHALFDALKKLREEILARG